VTVVAIVLSHRRHAHLSGTAGGTHMGSPRLYDTDRTTSLDEHVRIKSVVWLRR
jgi:hypothetical protein